MGTLAATVGVLAAVCGLSPQEQVSKDQVDLVEVNHYYDDAGRHAFDQVIFYDWSAADCRHVVRAWRMVKSRAQLPTRNWEDGTYTAIWNDGETLREVSATTMRESWTQYDPELVEREFLPKEKRRELHSRRLPQPVQASLRPIQRPARRDPQPPTPDSSR